VSTLWSLAWTAGVVGDTRQQFVDLARAGEALLIAVGGHAPAASARTLTADSSADQFSTWTDRYSEQADEHHAMPLSVLFAGVSGWDVRADRVVSALTSTTPPTWDQLRTLAGQREVPQSVAPYFDWFVSRDSIMEAHGNDLEAYASRAHRAWWNEALQRYPARSTPIPNTGGPLPTPVRSRGGGGGFFALLVLWGAARARARRGGRR